MSRANKAMLMGAVVAAVVLVFMPSVYVSIANKLGRGAAPGSGT